MGDKVSKMKNAINRNLVKVVEFDEVWHLWSEETPFLFITNNRIVAQFTMTVADVIFSDDTNYGCNKKIPNALRLTKNMFACAE